MCLIYPVPRIRKRFSVMKTWLYFLVCRVRLSRPHSENRWCPFSINKMNVWSLYFNQARGISEPSKRSEWGNHVPCQNPSEFAGLCCREFTVRWKWTPWPLYDHQLPDRKGKGSKDTVVVKILTGCPSSTEVAAAHTGEFSHITGKHLCLCPLVSRCNDKTGFIFGL